MMFPEGFEFSVIDNRSLLTIVVDMEVLGSAVQVNKIVELLVEECVALAVEDADETIVDGGVFLTGGGGAEVLKLNILLGI